MAEDGYLFLPGYLRRDEVGRAGRTYVRKLSAGRCEPVDERWAQQKQVGYGPAGKRGLIC